MTRLQIKVEVCDVCQMQGRPVEHYKVAAPGGRVRTLALCEEHTKTPLSELVARFARKEPARQRLASIDEVKAARKVAQPRTRAGRKG